MMDITWHEPVLTKEVLHYLNPGPGKVIVDGTLGHGGHSLAILDKLGGEGLLIGMDRDPKMLAEARSRIEASGQPRSCCRLVEADHAQLTSILTVVFAAAAPYPALDGLLLDLGPSTPQLLDNARGMSWLSDTALDMRMNPNQSGPTALEIVNQWDEDELTRLFREHADERWARRIATRIGEERRSGSIQTGRQLGEIVAGAIPRKAWPPKIHPATRVFLALRIEVNREYETLEGVLPEAFGWLKPGGRMVVISFHSGEDRRVKDFMRRMAATPEAPWPLPTPKDARPAARLLTKKPVEPGAEEIERNPRSRSARLRALEKLEEMPTS